MSLSRLNNLDPDTRRIALATVRKLCGTGQGLDHEQVQVELEMALWEAEIRTDRSRPQTARAFLIRMIYKHVGGEVRKQMPGSRQKRALQTVSMDCPNYLGSDSELQYYSYSRADRLLVNTDFVDRLVNQQVAEEMLARLDPRDALILSRLYLDGATLAQVGQELDLSPGRVYQLSRRACKRAAELYED